MASTTAVTETQFAEQFREFVKDEKNAHLRILRERAFEHFAHKGFPTTKEEDWKYTNLANVEKRSWTAHPMQFQAAFGPYEDAFKSFDFRRNGLTALNLAFAHILVGGIAKGRRETEPATFAYEAPRGTMWAPHLMIVAEQNSEGTILESYASPADGFINALTRIIVEDNAAVTHYRVQKDSAEAYHYGFTEVILGRNSRYDTTNINLGGAISRHDIDLKFTAEGGEAWVDGLYMLNGSQHSDTHSVIDHTVPNCTSHQNYKGVLNDNSRGVFNGKVFVRENAHGTDAQQSNKNLLLSNEARVDTKPQLEIFNDDVKCSHGATVGQLEEEELFYLLTRGLPDALARNLLTYGFAEAIIRKIGIESIKNDLDRAVLNRLSVKLEV
ncbi:MAG: Fe-S cluster assembly protein SufD [Pyrinomonadaceae bacterium]